MRVLFVTHSFPRHAGDTAGAFVLRLAAALGHIGVTVEVLAPSAPKLPAFDSIEGITVRRFRYAPEQWETLAYAGTMAEQVQTSLRGKAVLAGLLAGGTLAVRRSLSNFAPDVIHAHWWFPSGLMVLGAMPRQPLVTTMHGSDVRLAAKNRWAPALFRRVMQRSAAVTTVSAFLAGGATAMEPGLAAAIEPMPVNIDLFSPAGGRAKSQFLFVGRLNAQKGIRVLLDAMASTRADTTLDVVGEGPDEPALRTHASALGLATRVRWHGALPQQMLVPLYRSATALVVPSEDEGLGLVAVEAQLCETPVIAFRSGGLTDVIEDGITGILVAAGDSAALATAMDDATTNPVRTAELGKAGRAAALARFAPAAVAARYKAIYERVGNAY